MFLLQAASVLGFDMIPISGDMFGVVHVVCMLAVVPREEAETDGCMAMPPSVFSKAVDARSGEA